MNYSIHVVTRKLNLRRITQIKMFREIYSKYSRVFANGLIDRKLDIKLTIKMPNYAFRDTLDAQDWDKNFDAWYEHATPAGYGDVHEQVTRVNEEVRSAREITTEHFCVETKVIREVERLWAKHFLPGNVRAEPYKIQLYNQGHFKAHRDTPEENLVGTFLLGLGEDYLRWMGPKGSLVVDGQNTRPAELGT
jgi:hypothetical protein